MHKNRYSTFKNLPSCRILLFSFCLSLLPHKSSHSVNKKANFWSTQNSYTYGILLLLQIIKKKLIMIFHFLLLTDYEISACILQFIRKSHSPTNTIIVGIMHKINLLLTFMVFCIPFLVFTRNSWNQGQNWQKTLPIFVSQLTKSLSTMIYFNRWLEPIELSKNRLN